MFDGTMLPGNGAPVVGLMIGITVPLELRLCEKSPEISAAVGSFAMETFGV